LSAKKKTMQELEAMDHGVEFSIEFRHSQGASSKRDARLDQADFQGGSRRFRAALLSDFAILQNRRKTRIRRVASFH
jgi:hypothetical protein